MKIINSLVKSTTLLSFLILSACSFHGAQKPQSTGSKETPEKVSKKKADADGPPLVDVDVTRIPDATPRKEPLSKYGNMNSYEVFGNRYRVLSHSKGYKAEGVASWYGRKFHGRRTSSGEPYDMFSMTAAHRSLPLPTYVTVENLKNGRKIVVKVNDRGPFVEEDRLIDLSYAAAKKLGIYETGTGKVRITAIDPTKWQKQQIHLAAKGKGGKAKSGSKNTQLAVADKSSPKTGKKSAKKAGDKNTSLALAEQKAAKTKDKTLKVAQNSAKKSTAKGEKQIYLQLGAFNQKLNAQQLADHASTLTQAHNLNVHVLPSKLANKDLYKVRIGPLKNEEEAQHLQKKLVALNGSGKVKLVYE